MKMEEEADLINLSFASDSSTPKGKTSEGAMPLTPNTAQRIITKLGQTVDELMEFRQIEYEVYKEATPADNDIDALRKDLQDAKTVICDCRKEIAVLTDEVKKEKESFTQQQKDYELKLFRIQKELDQKNLEIVDLRKDKSEFDYRMKLFESRHARKIDELTQALKEARGTDLHVETNLTMNSETEVMRLKTEIDDGKAEIENLRELLAIQTARADQLSAAFADAITSWAQDAADIEQVLTDCNIHECLTLDDIDLHTVDESTIIMPVLKFDHFEYDALKSLNDEDINEMIHPAKDAISRVMTWARELLDLWTHDVKNFHEMTGSSVETAKEQEEIEITMPVSCKSEVNYSLQLESSQNLTTDGSMQLMDDVQIKNESGMTTYMSAAEDFVETVLTPENPLEDFAREFADYLIENQVFHPDDVPPRDPNVFNFLLDRYLLLIETYHNARAEFEEKVKELEEELASTVVKAEALSSHISQLEISDSTLCDTSITASSMELNNHDICDNTFADNSICATMLADATRDPLEITMDNIKCTPEQRKPRMSFLRTPQSQIPLGRSTPATKPRRSFIPTTPRIDEEEVGSQNPASIIKTPLNRIINSEVMSTAKKSVTFKSPLLARTEVEAENVRLKAMLAEKLDTMDHAIQMRTDGVSQLEERIEQLEAIANSATKALERAESEYSEKREALEKELAEVSARLRELTDKLIVEAVNLDPSLESLLRNQSPAYVLTRLLDTIIARFQKAQEEEKQAFEVERQGYASQVLEFTISTASLQMQVDQLQGNLKELMKDAERRQLEQAELEDKIAVLEEDVLRLTTDNRDLERDNAELNKECLEIKQKMSKVQEMKTVEEKEIESLKLALEATENEKNVSKSRLDQMEQEKNQLEVTLQSAHDLIDEISRSVLNSDNHTASTILEKISIIKNLVEKRVAVLNSENKILNDIVKSHGEELLVLTQEMISVKTALSQTEERIIQLESEVKSLEHTRNELKEQNMKLLTEISSTKDEAIQALKQEAIEMAAQYEICKIELENSKTELEDKLTIIKKLETDLQSSLTKIAAQEMMITGLEGKLSQLQDEKDKEIVDQVMLREKALEDFTQCKNEVDAKNQEIAGIRQELSAEIDKLNGVIREKEACVREMNLNLERLQLEVEKQSMFEMNVGSMKDDLNCLTQKLNDALMEKSNASDKLSAVELQLADALSRCNLVETELNEKRASVDAIIAEKSEISEKLGIVEQEKVDIVEKLSELERVVQDLKTVNEQLRAENQKNDDTGALKNEMNGMLELIGTLTAEKNEFAGKLLDVERSLAEEKTAGAEKLSEIEAAYSLAKNDLERVKQELADSEAVKQKLQTDFDASEKDKLEKLDSLRNELNETRELVNQLTEKLSQAEENLSAEKSAIAEKLSKTVEEYNEAKNNLLTLTEELKNSQECVEKLKKEIAALVQQSETEKLELIQSLTESKSELAEKLSHAEDEKSALAEKLSKIVDEYNEAKNNLLTITEELEKSQECIEKLKTEIATLGQQSETEKLELVQAMTESKNEQAEKLSQAEDHKSALTEKLSKTVEEYNEAKKNLLTITEELKNSQECVEKLKTEITTLVQQTETEKLELIQSLTELKNKHAEKLSQSEDEKSAITEKLSETEKACKSATEKITELETIHSELNQKIDSLTAEKTKLTQKLTETEQNLLTTKTELQAKKTVLAEQLSEIEQAYTSAKTDLQRMERMLSEYEAANEKLKTEKLSLEKEKQNLIDANTELENKNAQYKLTELAILRRLNDKQASDEAAMRLRSELAELKASCDNHQAELENLRKDLQKKSEESESVEKLNTSLEKNRGMVKNLESQISTITDLNKKVEELTLSNTELYSVLREIQQVLRLPEDAVKNLTMDTNTKSYLRMFRENVNRELNGLWTEREAMIHEKERLTIEVEKLTSDKVHFEIRASELEAFGKSQEEQIHALSGKLARLEASMSKRSRRSDPIGPRRLEKLEEMNKTLHDLIVGVINNMQMPNAEKMRLISQREVDAAAKQILDHAAKIASAACLCNTLKEQIKTLDQENQELSDSIEMLLKDNSRLEMKVLENQKSGTGVCTVCADLKEALMVKTDRLTKIQTEVEELKNKIKELDQENEELSDNVEALLKDNSKLEMQILDLNKSGPSKDCALCKNLKKKLTSIEDKFESLKTKSNDHAETLEKDLQTLREKCVNLEKSLKEKEQQLLQTVNNLSRPDEIRMRGSNCGLVQEITLNDKVRALTKDNTLLKELLRERSQTIKKLQAELKTSTEEQQVVMNSNSMDSPIRERKSGVLRTRGDVAAAYKRALRPGKSLGAENIY